MKEHPFTREARDAEQMLKHAWLYLNWSHDGTRDTSDAMDIIDQAIATVRMAIRLQFWSEK